MTNQEFSNEFDILYNNIASNQAPGLDEYEKSVFLTNAQEELVLELFSGKNPLGDSFEKTEEVRQYLRDIVKTKELQKVADTSIIKMSDKSQLFRVPEDVWFTTYESVKFDDPNIKCSTLDTEVVPVTQDEFSRVNKNPFRGPSNTRVLRLNIQDIVELISNYNISSYSIRYVCRLSPIVLEDLPEGLSIKGETKETQCKLNPAIHEAILERAVQLAKISMGLIETGR
jgi:hypothetical protein